MLRNKQEDIDIKIKQEQIMQEYKEIKKIMKKVWENNKDDTYFDPDHLDNFDYRFMISWLGKTYKPEKILEIGTRSGCSLGCLLHSYDSYNNVEVFSFDLWREYELNILKNKKISSITSKFIPFQIKKKLAQNRVLRNLRYMNVETDELNINFFDGDSRCNVPNFFEKNNNIKLDYALVDGGHDKTTAWCDLMNVVNHVKNGGILVFDDLIDNYNLITVWNDFKKYFNKSFDFYDFMVSKGFAYAIRKE